MTKARKGIVAIGLALCALQIVANSITDIVLGLAIVALLVAEDKLGKMMK